MIHRVLYHSAGNLRSTTVVESMSSTGTGVGADGRTCSSHDVNGFCNTCP